MITTSEPVSRLHLEQIDNELRIHCPSLVALNWIADYLTYFRPVTKRQNDRLYTTTVEEKCYQHSETDPLLLSCPAGFEWMLRKKFKRQFEFSAVRWRDNRITANTRPDWSLIDESQFRSGQKPILQALAQADQGRVVVTTAVGKSYLIGCYAILMPGARILVSTKNKPVLFELYEYLDDLLPGQAGLVCSGKNKNANARIVCVSQGTLGRYFPPGENQDTDVLIVDEYHEWGSPQKLELLSGVWKAKLFGLSGNEFRDDGAEFRLNGIFGPVLAKMDYAQAVAKHLVTPICVVWVPVRSDRDPVRDWDKVDDIQRYGVWQYPARNQAIADAARLFRDEDQVLISVRTIEHALYLRRHLPEYTLVYSPQDKRTSNMGMFQARGLTARLPDMTEQRLRELKQRFAVGDLKKVIATSIWSHGVNFPDLRVVIRADGMNSTIADTQWPGRAARVKDGKEISLVIDFTDEYNSHFMSKAASRRMRYSQHQWEQITLSDLKRLMGLPRDSGL